MNRTTLTLAVAGGLTALSLGVFAVRLAYGPGIEPVHGPATWHVTMVVQGRATAAEARVSVAIPHDGGRQHVVDDRQRGDGFSSKKVEASRGDRVLNWSQLPGGKAGPFRLYYDAVVTLDPNRVTRVAKAAAAPQAGEYLQAEPGIERGDPRLTGLSQELSGHLTRPADQVTAFYEYAAQRVATEPSLGDSRSAVECLTEMSGDPTAKSRLVVALCRQRNVPARLVLGLILTRGDEQVPHVWCEAHLGGHWFPMDPFYQHIGKLPRHYLTLGHNDVRPARGRNVAGLAVAYLVNKQPEAAAPADAPFPAKVLRAASLFQLAPAEQRLVHFLLLLPPAALLICLFRNVIGVQTFGTFAPALVGIAFREFASWVGVVVFVGLILAGWLLRRLIDRLHLLQVPRTSAMLSLVVGMLIALIVASHRLGREFSKYISLFPIVILVGMIERFWTVDEEDGTRNSLRTLLVTLGIAGLIALMLRWQWLDEWLFRHPETLGVVMAGQLAIGRYTGYRLMELYRFRDFTAG